MPSTVLDQRSCELKDEEVAARPAKARGMDAAKQAEIDFVNSEHTKEWDWLCRTLGTEVNSIWKMPSLRSGPGPAQRTEKNPEPSSPKR